MSFLTSLQHTPAVTMPSSADQIIWGVRRKFGYSEIDDPSAHRGLEQHAYVLGDYAVALCGTKGYAFRRPDHIRLAMPTEENPACRQCTLAIAFEVSEAVSVDRLTEWTAPADRAEIEKAVLASRRALGAGEPVSIDARRAGTNNWPVNDFSQAA